MEIIFRLGRKNAIGMDFYFIYTKIAISSSSNPNFSLDTLAKSLYLFGIKDRVKREIIINEVVSYVI